MGCCLLSFLTMQGVQAQFYTGNDVDGARWSLGFTGGVLVRPILSENPQRVSTGNGGESFGFTGEYFLPKKWAVYGGYERTELDYGYSSRSMEGINLGVKRYFVPDRWFVQPYLGIKVTFPMRFTQQDGFSLGGIIGSLIEGWFYRLDKRNEEYYYRY